MQAMEKLGLDMAVSKTAETLEEARDIAKNLIGEFPIIVRPAFTLGGTGGGIAYNQEEFEHIVAGGLDASMTSQVRAGYLAALFQLRARPGSHSPRWADASAGAGQAAR